MKLFLIALSFLSLPFSQQMEASMESTAELDLICVDVLICLANGECFILEVCAEEEDLEDYARGFDGFYNKGRSTLTVSGLSSFSSGSYLMIKPNTQLRSSRKGKTTNIFPSRNIVAGKYKVVNGKVNLKIGK